MSTDALYQYTVKKIGSLPPKGAIKPTQEDQLTFYGLFKQVNVGDVNTERPGMFDMAGKYKWDAWKKNEGKSQEDAKKEYVAAFEAILEKNPGPESDAIKAEMDAIRNA